ncbi:MAG: class I adenylate-forming enzyme family protein [Verrucomicrobiota bacterium]
MESMDDRGLFGLLGAQADAQPDAPFLYYEDEVVSFSQLVAESEKLARALQRSGVGVGDRVAVLLLNRPELVYAYFACFRLGAIAVPINTRYQRAEVAYVLEAAGVSAFIVGSNFFPMVTPLCRREELHEHTIVVDGKKDEVTPWPDYEDYVSGGEDVVLEWPVEMADCGAVMLHTSGSTARPKGVIHSHETLYSVARLNADAYGIDKLTTTPIYLSACYIGGLGWQLLRNLIGGKSCVLISKKEPSELLSAYRKHQCSDLVLLPTDVILMLEEPGVDEMDWSSLVLCASGGDRVTEVLQKEFSALTGVEITEGYGMTECGPATVNPAYGLKKVGSIGLPLPGAEVLLSSGETPHEVITGTGEIGEVWVKSPAVMVEYWRHPDATAEALVDGWLRTGDLAKRDEDGYYWFEGRKKLIIVRGGSNISPQEVEEVIDSHPAVMSCCVVGVPDATFGEIVRAYVELHHEDHRSAPAPSEDELMDYARHHIAAYKAPEQVIFLDEMPCNTTGKMDRAAMRKMALESVS